MTAHHPLAPFRMALANDRSGAMSRHRGSTLGNDQDVSAAPVRRRPGERLCWR